MRGRAASDTQNEIARDERVRWAVRRGVEPGHEDWALASAGVREWAERMGLAPGKKVIVTPAPEPREPVAISEPIGPECFGGSDQDSHYMATRQGFGIDR